MNKKERVHDSGVRLKNIRSNSTSIVSISINRISLFNFANRVPAGKKSKS